MEQGFDGGRDMKLPGGEEYEPYDWIEAFYVWTDTLVGVMAERGFPRWLYISVAYLVGMYIWSWLQGRPWRYW